jgi:hypothetical protein
MAKYIKVKYAKLGKQKAWGIAHGRDYIEIDERLKGRKHLEILLHECLHIILPQLEEEEVIKHSVILTNTLWRESYRRVEDHENMPLQDGSN